MHLAARRRLVFALLNLHQFAAAWATVTKLFVFTRPCDLPHGRPEERACEPGRGAGQPPGGAAVLETYESKKLRRGDCLSAEAFLFPHPRNCRP